MSVASSDQADAHMLEIALGSGKLAVSNLSSLLRVVQAALREVARGSDDTRVPFSQQPRPMLYLSTRIAQGEVVLGFTFAGTRDSKAMSQLSERVFSLFVERFGQFIKELPQRGLWGESVASGRQRQYESEVTRRLDQLRMELRRFPRARLKFDRQTILFEGDRMEIQQLPGVACPLT